MTPSEAIAYIENYTWSTTRLGLDRTRELLEKLGDPQKKLKFIHVAGSNGKGSTCAMLDAILRQAGYRTGLYTSPYIQDFCERIRLDGENIPGEDLAAVTEEVRQAAETMSDHPSQFELVTAVAMVYFLRRRCDIVVLEVGMGGALDSTNAIDAPEAAVITNIGLEHTEYLGSTLEEIAATKAGIIKSGCSCVCYDGAPEVTAVIRSVCAEKNVPLRCSDFSALSLLSQDLDGQRFTWQGKAYDLALLGRHQLRNAAVVLETVAALRQRGWSIPEEAVEAGLRTVRWPARLEIVCRHPVFLIDGGHNPQCADALAESLAELLPGRKAVFLLGVLADKDYPAMMERFLPFAGEFVCLTPLSPRALAAEDLAAWLAARGAAARAESDVAAGIRAALDAAGEDGVVVAVGSLYLVGAIRGAFEQTYRKWLRRRKIRARDALTPEERREKSAAICRRILASDAWRRAGTVMIYKYTRGEVQLTELEAANEAAPAGERKKLLYPLCVADRQMLAIAPGSADMGGDAWRKGSYGISEPDPDKGEIVAPEDIDLVIAPCTSFDDGCRRLGMGGGYYDRFLPRCTKARVIAVAYEVQRSAAVPTAPWDKPVDAAFTEDAVYGEAI
jgi:dihydrofolate synthase/folylpolyglutamate synthase